MEESVWGEPGVIDILKNDVVIISLFVDSKLELPKEEQFVEKVNGKDVSITTVGKKWSVKQINEYKTNTQPYYRMQDADGNDLSNGSADYDNHKYAEDFLAWLKEGLEEVKK